MKYSTEDLVSVQLRSKVCNKQFITLGHCEIWRHFTRTLYFHSPSARDNTVATREISGHTRKMVPITGRASSFLDFFCFFVCTLIERKRRRERQNNYRAINLPKVISLHRLQVHHLTLTFIIHNQYLCQHSIYIYIHTIHIL